MTTVDRLSGLLAQLRASLTDKSQRGQRSQKTRSSSLDSGTRARSQSGTESVRASLLSHLSHLDLSKDSDLQRARQLFVELVLVSEFGGHIASDGRFGQMSRLVEKNMSEDPAISRDLNEILHELADTQTQ